MTDQEFTKKLTRALEDAAFVEHHDTPRADSDALSPAARRKIRRILRDPLGCARALERPVWLRAARTAAMVTLALLVSLGTIMAVPTTRAYVQRIFTKWENEMFTVSTVGETDKRARHEADHWRLAYIPEGYTESIGKSVLADHLICYTSPDADPIYFTVRSTSADHELVLSTFRAKPETITLNGHDAYVFEAEKKGFASNLVWFDQKQEYMFHLTGGLPVEELLEMARSLTKSS